MFLPRANRLNFIAPKFTSRPNFRPFSLSAVPTLLRRTKRRRHFARKNFQNVTLMSNISFAPTIIWEDCGVAQQICVDTISRLYIRVVHWRGNFLLHQLLYLYYCKFSLINTLIFMRHNLLETLYFANSSSQNYIFRKWRLSTFQINNQRAKKYMFVIKRKRERERERKRERERTKERKFKKFS